MAGCVLAGCGEAADGQVMIDDDGNMIEAEAQEDAPPATAAAPASAGADGGLPDGLYECSMFTGTYLMGFGSIEIKGNRFRGPGYDGEYENDWEGYTLTDQDVILWDGPLAGLDTGGSSVESSIWTRSDSDGHMFVRLIVKSPAGNFNTIDCDP